MVITGSDETCKLILLGNGSVGKSSIISRFVDDGFSKVYKQTVGLDFFEKKITLRGDKHIVFQVWDIGGQSISSDMLAKYIYGSKVICLCYDVTDPQSFTDLEDWLALVHRTFQKENTEQHNIPASLYLVGNKIDLIHLRKITKEKHKQFVYANKLNGDFFVSAQNGDNVLKSFYRVAGKASGIELSEYELSFMEKAIVATITKDEASDQNCKRTAIADQIEAEDLAAEAKKRRLGKCSCLIL